MATLPEPLAVFTFTGENLGATEFSESEKLRWKGPSPTGGRIRELAVVIWHRFQKALAGAYRSRHVEIDIFTLASPERRQHFVAQNVGFKWPT
jgi:hypothetical protein